MTDLDIAIVTHELLSSLRHAHMVETPPLPNRYIDPVRYRFYKAARAAGVAITTASERTPNDPFMSVLRVWKREGRAT